MTSALEERRKPNSKCFTCYVKVNSHSSYNISSSYMPQRDVLLMDVMSKILNKAFYPSQMRISVLCQRCFIIFDELDQLSARFKKLKSDIVKRYESTCIILREESVMSNNENSLSLNEVPFYEQECESKSLDGSEGKLSSSVHEIVGTMKTNIQGEETIGIDDNFKAFFYDVNIKNESILEEVTDHIDNTKDNPNEEPIRETKPANHVGGNYYKCEQCDDTI